MRKKELPIGISDFKKVMEDDYYYVDKSLFIKEMIDNGSEIIVLPRPRRFGKTLNLSMLRYFYEKTEEDTSHLFRELAIWQQGDKYTEKQGQFPVIFLTFKDVKCDDWQGCFEQLQQVIIDEFTRHDYLLQDQTALRPHEQKMYQEILDGRASEITFRNSLKRLSTWLNQYHGQKTVILIDEYDTPIQEGYLSDYYDQVIRFVSNLLSGAFKDNSSLEKGVLTGILRIAKESIFSNFNNPEVCSLLDYEFSQQFGLLEHEVERMLKDYGIASEINEVKKWYNGYVVGDTVIYNPWSILNYTKRWRSGFRPYWVNTSSNELIRQVLTEGGSEVKKELECLLRGESIRKEISDNIVFRNLRGSSKTIWSLLLFSGYLKIQTQDLIEGIHHCNLAIPNREVAVVYRNIILDWFETSTNSERYQAMLEALINGEIKTFEEHFCNFVLTTFSMFDTSGKDDEPEKVYHAFVLGLLLSLQDTYVVKSNRESGYGRHDVMLIPKEKNRLGIVMEFKKVRDHETLEEAVIAALAQIEEKKYEMELQSFGVTDILKLGIAFQGKKVQMQSKS